MKKFFRSSVLISAMFASAFLLGGCEKEMEQDSFSASTMAEAKGGNSKSAQTAQSVMININAPDVIVVEGGEWVYNAEVAKTYFTSKNGQVSGAVNAIVNKCAFFYGGVLSEQGNAVPVGNGVVEAGTAWDFVPSSAESNGPREVSINFDLASQSVVINSNKGTKYNFALEVERIVDLAVKVVNEATLEEVVFPIAAENYVLIAGKENPYLYELPYITNAGKAGNTLDILQEGMTMSQVLQLNTLGFGSKNPEAEAAVLKLLEPLKLHLENGAYRVTVSGIIRGIEAATDANFAVDRTFEISGAPNCK